MPKNSTCAPSTEDDEVTMELLKRTASFDRLSLQNLEDNSLLLTKSFEVDDETNLFIKLSADG